ncbi:MAG: SGNH/GDSL hydrolase family protein [Actinobacteria bacterium]|nr:SGNH/GDSL hydrolase family protein [Actinomycetota bacterium]
MRYPWLAGALAAVCLVAVGAAIVIGMRPSGAAAANSGSSTQLPAGVSPPTNSSGAPVSLAPLIAPDDPLAQPSIIPLEDRPKVVFIGDSITLGTSDFANGFVGDWSWFYALVNAPDAPVAFAGGVADNGMRTSWMAEHVWDALSKQPDMLIVLGGTNDIAPGADPATSLANLQRIVDAAAQAGVKVAVCTIPPSDKPNVDELTRAYNDALKVWADSTGIILLDTAAPLRGPEGVGWAPELTTDGTHPSPEGAVRMSQAAATTLRYLGQ